MFLWIIVLIAVVAGAWYLTQRGTKAGWPGEPKQTPLDILKSRFARGEITKEEYEERKEALEEKEFM